MNNWLTEQKNKVSARDYKLLAKALSVLKLNICEGEEYPWYPYRLFRPFGDNIHRVGVWNWDTAFHAIGALYFDETLAKEQILGFVDFQLDDGMFVDVKWADEGAEDCSSKPPILAWAAGEIFKKTKDTDFLKRVYPRFVKNEEFWRKQRFYHDMFHYGGNINKVPFERFDEYVRWESGWDNSVRWDNPCSDYWPIDLNCYAVMMYRGLAVMAKGLGYLVEAAVYETREKELTENINKYLWNDEVKAYTDTNRFDGTSSKIMTPASFMPLYIGISSQERAEFMERFASDSRKLYPGMPTVAYDDPEYSQGYWRGNTWLNVAYFAAKGLKNYGFEKTAEDIRQTILGWVENDGDCIHENYNSTTGEGLFCTKFSWSAVFVMEFILNF